MQQRIVCVVETCERRSSTVMCSYRVLSLSVINLFLVIVVIGLLIALLFGGSCVVEFRGLHGVKSRVSNYKIEEDGCAAFPTDPNSFDFKSVAISQDSPYSTGKVPIHNNESILILTPISNAEEYLERYFKILCNLKYPKHLLSVALGEDSSQDNTLEKASSLVKQLDRSFRRVEVFSFEDSERLKVSRGQRHRAGWQLQRRTYLAKSRNELLFRALQDEKWVLWLDVDVTGIPPDIIQHLLSAKQPIVAPSCMYRRYNQGSMYLDTYDRNSWRETKKSQRALEKLNDDYLVVEGYSPTKRRFLPDITEDGLVVRLDGVGGCTLLVSAQSHRDGLVFPPFVFNHHIETEGLAKMATAMKIPVYGMPFVFVVHD